MSRRSATLSLLTLVALPAVIQAQGRLVDEGTFELRRNGARIGTEAFQIRMIGPNVIRATGRLTLGDQQITSSLATDTLGTPMSYELGVKGGVQLTAAATRPGRLSALAREPHGNESMKEYVIAPGTSALLDDDFVHQLYLVTVAHRSGGSVRVVAPRTGREYTATLTPGGMETIDIGGRSATATHYTLSGGGTRHEFWVDSAGRVLRVAVDGQALVAVRDELPR